MASNELKQHGGWASSSRHHERLASKRSAGWRPVALRGITMSCGTRHRLKLRGSDGLEGTRLKNQDNLNLSPSSLLFSTEADLRHFLKGSDLGPVLLTSFETNLFLARST